MNGDNMNYIGWLNREGKHFECDNFEHSELTKEILKEYYELDYEKMSVLGREDVLFDKGWCRIGFQSMLDCGYVIQARWSYVSEEQKSFIQNMFFDVGGQMTEQTMNDLKDYGIIDLYQDGYQTSNNHVKSRVREKITSKS